MARSEVVELRPSATSVMPVGLIGAIGEEGLRDLLAYLATLRGEEAVPAEAPGPAPRTTGPASDTP